MIKSQFLIFQEKHMIKYNFKIPSKEILIQTVIFYGTEYCDLWKEAARVQILSKVNRPKILFAFFSTVLNLFPTFIFNLLLKILA